MENYPVRCIWQSELSGYSLRFRCHHTTFSSFQGGNWNHSISSGGTRCSFWQMAHSWVAVCIKDATKTLHRLSRRERDSSTCQYARIPLISVKLQQCFTAWKSPLLPTTIVFTNTSSMVTVHLKEWWLIYLSWRHLPVLRNLCILYLVYNSEFLIPLRVITYTNSIFFTTALFFFSFRHPYITLISDGMLI